MVVAEQNRHLIPSLQFLVDVIKTRISLHLGKEGPYENLGDIPVPHLNGEVTHFSQFLMDHDCTRAEFIILLLALAPHCDPLCIEQAVNDVLPEGGNLVQMGGVRGKNHRGFLPTGETILFLLAGSDIEHRFKIQSLLDGSHFFSRKRVLYLEPPPEGEPPMSGRLIMSQDYVDLFTQGKISRPKFSMNFPAQYIETELEWEDLVLNEHTLKQIRELETWVKHGDTLLYDWGMKSKLKLGYRVLFHGPPGTGKTLTATLLGKYTGRDVFKVDLSVVVSKFIGETEKNLSSLFERAENKGWILFFDEADALFGKRTNVRDAHDKYANQEVSYLLQRVENFNGLVILASNFKSNIDESFTRRFQSIIYFPPPKFSERLQIWNKAFPSNVRLAEDIDLKLIARQYELTGANIMNVTQYACLKSLEKGEEKINLEDLLEGITREFNKEGKVV